MFSSRCSTPLGRLHNFGQSQADLSYCGQLDPLRLPRRESLDPLRPQDNHPPVPAAPKQPGYNKRLRTLTTQITHLIAVLATDTDLWQHPIRIADSTPVPCGTSRETVQRSDLAGWAACGYCASHSRRFWDCVCTWSPPCTGLPVAFALTNAKTDEREVLTDLVTLQPNMFHHPDGLILVVDKGYRNRDTETWLNERDTPSCDPRTATNRHARLQPATCRGTERSVRTALVGEYGRSQAARSSWGLSRDRVLSTVVGSVAPGGRRGWSRKAGSMRVSGVFKDRCACVMRRGRWSSAARRAA
jgi:hypothetical protein